MGPRKGYTGQIKVKPDHCLGDPDDDKAETIRRKDIEIERLSTQVNSLISETAELELRNSFLQNRIKALKAGYD